MADDADMTCERMEREETLFVADVCRKAKEIPAGEPGECFLCGEYFARVVYIVAVEAYCCGKCRDRRGLG